MAVGLLVGDEPVGGGAGGGGERGVEIGGGARAFMAAGICQIGGGAGSAPREPGGTLSFSVRSPR